MLPEIELQRVVDLAIKTLREDYALHGGTPSDTILYYLMNTSGDFEGKYDFFDQAVEIFITKDKHSERFLESRLFFDRERAAIPTVHIMATGENSNHNGIGVDVGYQAEQVIGGSQRSVLTRHFDANFSIVVTSDNSMEAILVYHVLKGMLISVFTHIQLCGFIDPVISGRDINISQEVVPSGVFARSIDFKAGYEISVPEFTLRTIITKFVNELNPKIN